jgi:hypothetical protein
MAHDIRQLLKGTLAGGLAIFLMHGFGWGALPFTNRAIHAYSDTVALASLQTAAQVQPGTYYINANAERNGLAAASAPHGWMTVHPADSYSAAGALGGSLVINLGWALLASWLVLVTRRDTFAARFRVGVALTAFGVLCGPVWDWAWGWYSPAYAAAVGLNTFLGFLAMAVCVAWLVKPALSSVQASPISAPARAA